MDPDRARDRLLWLAAEGALIQRDARRLYHRVGRVRLVDAADLAREIAELAIVAQARRDEVAQWALVVVEEEPLPMPEGPTEAPGRRRR